MRFRIDVNNDYVAVTIHHQEVSQSFFNPNSVRCLDVCLPPVQNKHNVDGFH